MTHDEILKAARERLAEIDREKARLEDERGKLQALLGVQPTPQFVPVLPPAMRPPYPHEWRPLPDVTWTPWPTLGTFGITAEFPFLAFNEDFTPRDPAPFRVHDLSSDLVIGGEQRPSSIRFA